MSFSYICSFIPVFFFFLVGGEEAQGHFDRMSAADGYVRADLLIAAGTELVNIKLMGGSF